MKNKKFYPWLVVALLWVVALLNYMDRQMLSTMKAEMMVDIAELESAANFGRLMAVFLWIYGLVSPFAGMVADRINRKWLIIPQSPNPLLTIAKIFWIGFVTGCVSFLKMLSHGKPSSLQIASWPISVFTACMP